MQFNLKRGAGMEFWNFLRASSLKLFFLLVLSGFLPALALPTNKTSPMVPALIVFGDSIVDPGNNNVIVTTVKSNFPPYGQDFAGQKPTGRFSNGKIPSDLIVSGLGIKDLLPAYLGTKLEDQDILTGVNFASGGAGFDPLTAKLVSVLSMTDQLDLFKEYKEKLKAIVGEERGATIVSESLYLVVCGTDDIANTYFGTPFRRPHYDIPSYVNLMVTSTSSFIKELIQLGAHKIAFVGLPPIGCLPSQRTVAGGIMRECDPTRNQAALLYNSKINEEFQRLRKELRGTRIVLVDFYTPILDIIHRPSEYGFEESTKGCCGTGKVEASVFCNSLTPITCKDDTKYVFWDSYHPTETAYKILVDIFFQDYLKFFL